MIDNKSIDLNSSIMYDSLNNSITAGYYTQAAGIKGSLGLMKINDE
jgi:hypothetical protein